MKANKIWGALLATTFGFAAIMAPTNADAEKKKKTEVVVPTGPAQAVNPIKINPASAGLSWGLSVKDTSKAIDRMLDAEYKPIYKVTSPGIKMKMLDSQLREEKSSFRRSRIDFGRLPVALDATPLAKEYSYRNNESLMKLDRKGETRYFFFIQDRLWKIIDEVNLEKTNPYGKTLQDVAVKFSTLYGAAGRVIAPDPAKQIYSTTIDWKDATTHVRLVERYETAVAIVYEDNATLDNIDTLRVNKPVIEDDIPADIRALKQDPEPERGPPPAPEKDNKKK